MNKMQTLHAFWSSFGLVAYDETTVPDVAKLPYITYEAKSDSFGAEMAVTASLWYRDSSWVAITEKAEAISDFITRGGRTVSYDGGAMWIRKGTPWAQRMSDGSNDMIRRIYLTLIVEFLD